MGKVPISLSLGVHLIAFPSICGPCSGSRDNEAEPDRPYALRNPDCRLDSSGTISNSERERGFVFFLEQIKRYHAD